jgi:regulatory protein
LWLKVIKNKEGFDRARRYAFLLLKFRLRSEQEIALRLKLKGHAPEAIKSTVSFLKEKGFLDDNVFAREWILSRLKKPYGSRRIAQELRAKGIDKTIIERQLHEAGADDSQEEAVACLAKSRLARLKSMDPIAAKRRVYAYLIRRGFGPEVASEVLNQL